MQNADHIPRRGITITLSPGTVISSITVLCAGFVLVFVLGILMGRGYNLEAAIPALDKVMPRGGTTQPPAVVSIQEVPPDAQRAGEAPLPAASNKNPAQTAAPTRDTAKQTAQDSAKTPSPGTKPADKQTARPTEKAAAKPQGKQETPPAKPQPSPSRAAVPGQTAPVRTSAMAAAPKAEPQIYRYVYQAAAYRDEPSCDKFVAELKKAGFQARTLRTVEGSSVWYRTMIDFTGKPDDTDALRAALRNRGIPKVILKSKTPIGP